MAATATERIRSSTYDVNGTETDIKSYIATNSSATGVINYSVSWKTNTAGTKYAVFSVTKKIN